MTPPDVREWLPEDHFAWFVLGAVELMELDPFYAALRHVPHAGALDRPRNRVPRAYAYRISATIIAGSNAGGLRPSARRRHL